MDKNIKLALVIIAILIIGFLILYWVKVKKVPAPLPTETPTLIESPVGVTTPTSFTEGQKIASNLNVDSSLLVSAKLKFPAATIKSKVNKELLSSEVQTVISSLTQNFESYEVVFEDNTTGYFVNFVMSGKFLENLEKINKAAGVRSLFDAFIPVKKEGISEKSVGNYEFRFGIKALPDDSQSEVYVLIRAKR